MTVPESGEVQLERRVGVKGGGSGSSGAAIPLATSCSVSSADDIRNLIELVPE